MGKKDPRIDAYITKAAEFAKPILKHIRKTVHAACPQVEETVKWGMPFYDYKGPLCHMAAFNQHCAMGFWKGELILAEGASNREAMGQFGRITSVSDLPSEKILAKLIKKAMALNVAGVKAPSRAVTKNTKPVKIPSIFSEALRRNPQAGSVFAKFTLAQKREYVVWIGEAKTEETREKRLATAMEWIGEGKTMNWKYKK